MVDFYVRMIKNGVITIDDVHEYWRKEVAEKLKEEGEK